MKARAILIAVIVGASAASSSFGASVRDGAVIQNSGSTNASGYIIKLWSNGTASVLTANRTGATTGEARSASVPQTVAQQFFVDLRGAKAHGEPPMARCMKSTSFGSTTRVRYHGWQSSDLECPGNPQLANDVHAIARDVQAGGMTHPLIRHPLLPNEPRRPEATPQASATPESGSPAPYHSQS